MRKSKSIKYNEPYLRGAAVGCKSLKRGRCLASNKYNFYIFQTNKAIFNKTVSNLDDGRDTAHILVKTRISESTTKSDQDWVFLQVCSW